MKHFTSEPLSDILSWAEEQLQTRDTFSLDVLNPDVARSSYAGECVTIDETVYLYRSYKAWNDLAQLLFCRLLTPERLSDHTVRLTFEKIDVAGSFHASTEKEEKYGTASEFARIHKNEEPAFLAAYRHALRSVRVGKRTRILNLGINTGDEFDLIRSLLPVEEYARLELVGIDHSESAIAKARERFDEGNAAFFVCDINHLEQLELGEFDLIITIGTLQSPEIDFKPLFGNLVQEYLKPDGAMIVGFPNCRWMGGEMIYGAKAPNYPYSELSLVIKDIHWCKKYLQQKKFRVTLTGRDYLFLTATSIR